MSIFIVKKFEELNTKEFHDIIQLRINVFVVEQNCPYEELDGKDELAFHLFQYNEKNELTCTCRILPKGISYPEVSIGRVATSLKHRNTGLGFLMMQKTIAFIEDELKESNIRISAQEYLLKFYQNLGFVETGKKYLEDGIPHIEMLRNKL